MEIASEPDRPVQVQRDGPVGVVTLNRPDKLNAMAGEMYPMIGAAYAELDADDTVRAIVLTGAGRAFCAGADLSARGGAFKAPRQTNRFRSSPPRPLAFQLRKPVIAAINGHAIGVGLTLALHCDLRIIAEEAKWGAVQVRRGVVSDAISHWTLVRALGTARAAELLLLGELHMGADALAMGLVTECLPADAVLPRAMDMAHEIAQETSPLSIAFSKRIMWAAADGDAALVDDLESEAHRVLMGAPDALEGGQAAYEKRSPQWQSVLSRDWPTDGPFADESPFVDP
jgi:enoyl-CoA hydratase/carnithine racemase